MNKSDQVINLLRKYLVLYTEDGLREIAKEIEDIYGFDVIFDKYNKLPKTDEKSWPTIPPPQIEPYSLDGWPKVTC